MKKRLLQLRKSLNLNQQKFATPLGISRSYVAALENGKRQPSDTLINLISLHYGISVTWLKIGKGEMFNSPETLIENQIARFGKQAIIDALKKVVGAEEINGNLINEETPLNKTVSNLMDLIINTCQDSILNISAKTDYDYSIILTYILEIWNTGDQRRRDWLVIQFEKYFPDCRTVHVLEHNNCPDLARILEYLSRIWEKGERRIINWALIQFEKAFPDYQNFTQKKLNEINNC